jgi:hypothetical protein
MAGTPLKITIYGANDAENKEYSRSTIAWGILKKAIALTKSIDAESASVEDIDAIASLVVDAFGGQFSIQDLDKGADIGEMMAVLQSIVARAGALVNANPTVTPPTAKKKAR